MLVPRSQVVYGSPYIGINALGFSGTLFVSSPERLQELKRIGPHQLLVHVGFPVGRHTTVKDGVLISKKYVVQEQKRKSNLKKEKTQAMPSPTSPTSITASATTASADKTTKSTTTASTSASASASASTASKVRTDIANINAAVNVLNLKMAAL